METTPERANHETQDTAARRTIQRLQWSVIGLSIAFIALAAWVAVASPRSSLPSVLAVERLEIVEADGSPALALANSQRVPSATMDGRILLGDQEEERRGAPGIIFFDGHGDEVGGLTFGNQESEEGFSALRHFSLDGYEQDQTIVMHHYQDPGGASTGITISDRPWDLSMLEAMDSLGLEPGATREEFQQALMRIPDEEREARARELFGVRRVFIGSSRDDQATLVMHDGEGRPRIQVGVPLDGEPFIRILDEDGEVVSTLR